MKFKNISEGSCHEILFKYTINYKKGLIYIISEGALMKILICAKITNIQSDKFEDQFILIISYR